MMINLLETALKKLSELSTEKQEKIAHLILEQIEENGNLDAEISPRQPLHQSEERGQNEGLNLANRRLLSSSQDYTLDELLAGEIEQGEEINWGSPQGEETW